MKLLWSVWVRFSFRQLLAPAYTSQYLLAPSGVVGVIYRDFNLLHRSLLKWFPLFIWVLFAVSSVPNFRPDTGGRRWTHSACQFLRAAGREGCYFPHLCCSGSWLLYMEHALCCMLFQFSGIPQKRGLSCACFLCLPRPEQLRQPGA